MAYAGPLPVGPDAQSAPQENCESSGLIPVAAATVIKAVPGNLYCASVTGGTLTIYDNPSAASGKVITAVTAPAGTTVVWTPSTAAAAHLGITVGLSAGTGHLQYS